MHLKVWADTGKSLARALPAMKEGISARIVRILFLFARVRTRIGHTSWSTCKTCCRADPVGFSGESICETKNWQEDHVKERPELFMQADTVRPGVSASPDGSMCLLSLVCCRVLVDEVQLFTC